MTQKYTSTDKVNLRSSAGFGRNVIKSLPLSQIIEVTGNQVGDRWLPVKTSINGSSKSGYISKNVLRNPVSKHQESLISQCVKEWLRFDRGKGQENKKPYTGYVGEMWKKIGHPDRDGNTRKIPWSAAFISFVVRNAGGYSGFKYHQAHGRYVHEAITKKLANTNYPFWGFRINDHKVKLGDMVCAWRNRRINYDYAISQNKYDSHCDIVVAIEDNAVLTIGGNVSHSVKHKRFKINSNGYLKNEKNVYAVLANRR